MVNFVEKFIVAIFGLPVVTSPDALIIAEIDMQIFRADNPVICQSII